jgi:Domain of unknown function (DUF4034)
MVLSALFNSRRRKTALAIMKAARERGMSVEEFVKSTPKEELARYLPRDERKAARPTDAEPAIEMPDVTLFGLPPDDEVTVAAFTPDAEVAAAVAAARGGAWEPGAELLARIGRDWDRRGYAVRRLGQAAADDETALAAWRAARPGDPDAAVVNASSLVDLAWQIRTGRQPEHVSREQWAGFFRVLEDAEAAARRATELFPDDPTPWATLLTVAMGRQYDNDAFRAVWVETVARDPLHRAAHDRALQYWCAKWFGSHELMFEFAEQAAAASPKLAALPLVAAHEAEFADVPAWTHERVGRALDRLLPWLDGAGRDHPMTHGDRAYAACALVENDRNAEAVEQFRRLGPHADNPMWSYRGKGLEAFLTTRYLACYRSANATP